MGKRIASFDAGRSKCLCVYIDEKGRMKELLFSSRHGEPNFDYLKTAPVVSWNTEHDIIVSINDQEPIIIGDSTEKILSIRDIIYATTDEVYLKFAKNYILAGLAQVMNDKDKIILSINLTATSGSVILP